MLNPTLLRQDQQLAAGDSRGLSTTHERGGESRAGASCGSHFVRRCRPATSGPTARGFTLIELMMVVAVLGVLSGIAYPSFMGQVQKVRRADAMLSMLQVQVAQERWRANNLGYGTLAEIGVGAISAAGHYTLQIADQSAQGYEVLASALGSQAHDTNCRKLRLRVEGGNLIQASGTDATTNNAQQQNRQCWIV